MSLFNGDTSLLRVGTGVKIRWRQINTSYAVSNSRYQSPSSVSEFEKIDKGIIVRVFERVNPNQPVKRILNDKKIMAVTEPVIAVCDLNSFRAKIVPSKNIIELDIYSVSLEEMLTCKNKEVRELALAINLLTRSSQ